MPNLAVLDGSLDPFAVRRRGSEWHRFSQWSSAAAATALDVNTRGGMVVGLASCA
jgi:hypothetical protein